MHLLADMFKYARISNLFCDIVETLGQIFWLNPPPLNFSIDKNISKCQLAPVQEMTNTIYCFITYYITTQRPVPCTSYQSASILAIRMLKQAPLFASLLSLRSAGGQN